MLLDLILRSYQELQLYCFKECPCDDEQYLNDQSSEEALGLWQWQFFGADEGGCSFQDLFECMNFCFTRAGRAHSVDVCPSVTSKLKEVTKLRGVLWSNKMLQVDLVYIWEKKSWMTETSKAVCEDYRRRSYEQILEVCVWDE